jgi:hypothetical protein
MVRLFRGHLSSYMLAAAARTGRAMKTVFADLPASASLSHAKR